MPLQPRCPTGSNRVPTILFVEDEVNICEVGKIYLESKGYRIFEASNSNEALVLWQKHQSEIDLVVTDLKMPCGGTGHQLVRRLRIDRPDLKVIFTSGSSADSSGNESLLDGNTNFLLKPYRLNGLAEMIHGFLSDKKAAA